MSIEIFPMFAIGIGMEKCPQILPQARALFDENKKFLNLIADQKYYTTLTSYAKAKHTPDYKDSQNLKDVKNLIQKGAVEFLQKSGYFTGDSEITLNSLWLNEMPSGSSHHLHQHYGYQLSGCLYVDMPKDSGFISFINPCENIPLSSTEAFEFTPYNSGMWRFIPAEGDLYFWRADLKHEVPFSEFEGIRRSIAFDINVADNKGF